MGNYLSVSSSRSLDRQQSRTRKFSEVSADESDKSLWKRIKGLWSTATMDAQSSPDKSQRNSKEDLTKLYDDDALDHNKDVEEFKYLDFLFLTQNESIGWVRKNKVMFIMRGLPGSGKSTVVKAIQKVYPDVKVCSADDYFLNAEGVYEYRRADIKLAHEFCQQNAKRACEDGVGNLVIDNTHIQKWEMHFYFNLASKFGYRIVLVEPRTPWKTDAQILATTNKHGVDETILSQKIGQFRSVIPLYFAWFFSLDDSQCLVDISYRWLSQCLESCEDFRSDFESFSRLKKIPEMLKYFDRDECLRSNKDIVHCTAKYCGKNSDSDEANDYYNKAKDSIGRVFELCILGFVVTERTLGARIKLSEEELELYDNDRLDTNDQKILKQMKKTKSENNLNKDEENIAKQLEQTGIKDAENRFYPVPGFGKRAHVTIGTSSGVKPVMTGLDLLDVVKYEKEASEGCRSFKSYTSISGAVVRQYEPGYWVIYPDKGEKMDCFFSGHYF